MIIAIKEKDKVVIGYSNAESWGRLSEKDYVDEENVAIKFSEDGKLFACAEMNRRSDILLYDEEFLSMKISAKSIVRDIVPYIKKKLKDNDQALDEGRWKNALIICDNERLYDIDPLFGLYEADDYVCHGYRVETLKCVLDETTEMSAEERIMKAIIFVSELHKESMFPIIITDTKSKKFKYVYEGEKKYERIDSI